MPKFLSTSGLKTWILKIIDSSVNELLIVIPYIKTSASTYEHLNLAGDRGVSIRIIFRDDKLSLAEHQKLMGITNLLLYSHPNVHCKCYLNENYLLITSMNMYAYSEENNREMGVLFSREPLEGETAFSGGDNEDVFDDAIQELREISNGVQPFAVDADVITPPLHKLAIIKSKQDFEGEYCKEIIDSFPEKIIEIVSWKKKSLPCCKNYFDRVNIWFDKNRQHLDLQFDEPRLEQIFESFQPDKKEYLIPGFKLYWRYYKSTITFYLDKKHAIWIGIDLKNQRYKLVKQGLAQLYTKLRPHISGSKPS